MGPCRAVRAFKFCKHLKYPAEVTHVQPWLLSPASTQPACCKHCWSCNFLLTVGPSWLAVALCSWGCWVSWGCSSHCATLKGVQHWALGHRAHLNTTQSCLSCFSVGALRRVKLTEKFSCQSNVMQSAEPPYSRRPNLEI